MKLGAGTSQPDRVLGLHFFNPVPVLPLVEIVTSIMTTPETVERARAFAEGTLGKQAIDSQDRAGFVVNALLIPYLLSAIRMYESGFASKEDIDQGMVLGCAHPMGPLRLADLIGLDTLLAVSESLYEEFRDPAPWPRRCSTGWSRRACWAARPAAGSTTTRRASGLRRPGARAAARAATRQPRIDEWRAITRQVPSARVHTSVSRKTFDRLTCS